MELHEYMAILRKRWSTVVGLTLALVAVAVALTLLATPQYTATAKTFVSVRTAGTAGDLAQGSAYTQSQVESYAELATLPTVLDPVIEELGLDVRASALASTLDVSVPVGTALIAIEATDPSPERAAAVANGVADHLAAAVPQVAPAPAGEPDPVRISTVAAAEVPTAPSSPNATLNLAIGLAVGLLLGVGVAVLRETLDTKVRTPQDVGRVTPASVIGTIPFDADAAVHPLVVQGSPQSPRAEAFRRLRTNLQFLDVGDRPRAIVVASALPGEGKSTTAINLAITLADAGTRVLLVDADLRRPSVARYLGVEGGTGLTAVLIGRAQVEDVVQPWGGGSMSVLPAGQIPPNPSELLGSLAMATLLKELTEQYDVVLLDTAPLLPVTDGALLAKVAGGALLTVGAGSVHRQELQGALASLDAVDARVLGVVLNKVVRHAGDRYPYYDYAYQQDAPTPVPARGAPRRHARDATAHPVQARVAEGGPAGPADARAWPGEPLSGPR